MKKHLFLTLLFLVYCAILVKVMVFKDVPTIKVGAAMFDFAGTNGGNPPNFIPFKTILPYLLGQKGLLIGGLNLLGNIVFLVPIGLLLPFLSKHLNWQKTIILSIVSGLAIELMQVVLQVGIFDIDDVMLNAIGVMVGYGTTKLLLQWFREKKYTQIFISTASVTIATATVAMIFVIDIRNQPKPSILGRQDHAEDQINSGNNENTPTSNDKDPCLGTGGNGEIVSIENEYLLIKRKDGKEQTIYFTDRLKVETSSGVTSKSDLQNGDKITLVGDVNQDGSFSADTLVVCGD